jgi:hypothetical protein
MELPSGGVEICPVNFPSPLAALRAVQADCAGVRTVVAANRGVRNNDASKAAGTFLMRLSYG